MDARWRKRTSESLAASGFRGVLHPAELVGRQTEFAALDAALDRAVRFRAPQVVTVIGSLGLGKTRLLNEWLAEVGGPGLRVVRASLNAAPTVDAHDGNLVGAILRQRFGIGPHLGRDAALVQFRTEMQRVFVDRRVAEVAALLGHYIGFDLRESPLSRAFATVPGQGADLARAVLCRFLEQDAADSPLIIAIDDLHLADDASLDILEKLASELGEAAVTLIATARPDLLLRRPEWGRGQGSHTRVELAPLSRLELDAMIRSILDAAGPEPLPSALPERAAAESGGNPHLLEQLLHVYSRDGILVAESDEGWWFDVERAQTKSLVLAPEEAAQGRVGTLTGAERDLLTRAAAFGPVFWTGGVVALGRVGAEPFDPIVVFAPDAAITEVRETLSSLARRDILQLASQSGVEGDVEWSFKHPPDVDLILAGVDPDMLGRRRRFAAQWLESRGGSGREARFETLGRLYQDGDDPRRAAYCYLAAGADARQRAELERARGLYLRAVRLLETDDAVAKMDAYAALGDVAARAGRAREALAHFQEMLRLSWRLDLPRQGGNAHGSIGRLHAQLGEHRAALQHLRTARQLFEIADDLPGIAATLTEMGRVHLMVGEPVPSLEHHRAAYQVRDRLGDDRGRAEALAHMGQVEREMGDLGAAEGHMRQAIQLRRRAGDRPGLVGSLLDLGNLERDFGRVPRAVAILDEALALAREIGERLYECSIAIALGDSWLMGERPLDAQRWFSEAKEIARQFGAKRLLGEAGRGLAEARLAAGETLDARDEARAAFEIAERIGAPSLSGAALRVMASAVGAGAPGDADLGGAREMFDRAIAILSNVTSELELGRTLSAYAELEQAAGRPAAATELRRQADLIRTQSRTLGSSHSRMVAAAAADITGPRDSVTVTAAATSGSRVADASVRDGASSASSIAPSASSDVPAIDVRASDIPASDIFVGAVGS